MFVCDKMYDAPVAVHVTTGHGGVTRPEHVAVTAADP